MLLTKKNYLKTKITLGGKKREIGQLEILTTLSTKINHSFPQIHEPLSPVILCYFLFFFGIFPNSSFCGNSHEVGDQFRLPVPVDDEVGAAKVAVGAKTATQAAAGQRVGLEIEKIILNYGNADVFSNVSPVPARSESLAPLAPAEAATPRRRRTSPGWRSPAAGRRPPGRRRARRRAAPRSRRRPAPWAAC